MNGAPHDLVIELIAPDDPRMHQVNTLRHEALFEPFGLPRNDSWDDAGSDRCGVAAFVDGDVVGYASLVVEQGGECAHIRQVCVKPGLQRGGIGSAVMLGVEDEAIRRGIPLLWLNARKSAEAFYQRLGWVTVSGVFPTGRTQLPHVRMEKRPGW